MKASKKIILIFLIITALFACACNKEPAAYETSRIIGIRNEDSIRFEDFGLTVKAPQGCEEGWLTDVIPETYDELNAIIAEENCYTLTWTDLDSDEGARNFNIQIMTCEDGMKETDVLNYYIETFTTEKNANSAEIKKIPLGDNPYQKCFVANYVNDEGVDENIVIFDKIAGTYYIECAVSTICFEGAEKLAQEIYFIDDPMDSVPEYETSPVLGRLHDDTLYFDEFSLKVTAPNTDIEEDWSRREIPQTLDELNEILEKDECFSIFCNDFETEEGSFTIVMNIFPRSGDVSENLDLKYMKDYYLSDMNVSRYEIISLPIGDNESKACLAVDYINDNGENENLLFMCKVYGNYCIEYQISSRESENLEDIAKNLIYEDAPQKLPFSISQSGRFILENRDLLGKSYNEIKSTFSSIGEAADYPWWDKPCTCCALDVQDNTINLIFDKSNNLYCIFCEDVDSEKYESALDASISSSEGIYYYWQASDPYFADGKYYYFYVDDSSHFTFAKISNDDGTTSLTQRYYNEPISYSSMVDISRSIIFGFNDDMSEEHALKLVDFAKAHGSDGKTYRALGTFYQYAIKDENQCIEYYKKAVELGDLDAVNEFGQYCLYFLKDFDMALWAYDKGAEAGDYGSMLNCGGLLVAGDKNHEPDYNAAVNYYLRAYDTYTEGVYNVASYSLFELLFKHADNLSDENREAIDEIYTSRVDKANSGNTRSMVLLGYYYVWYMNDYASAKEWYEKALDAGATLNDENLYTYETYCKDLN